MLQTEVSPPRPFIANATLDTIYQRRAVRKYKNTPVNRKLVNLVLEAAKMAPSALNLQPYRFIVMEDREAIRHFSAAIAKVAEPYFHLTQDKKHAARPDPIFYNAPVVIFIAGPKNNEWAGLDIGMCAQNLMLAARSIGLETCPVGFAKLVEQTSLFRNLQLHNTEQIYLAIVLGYGDEFPAFHGRKENNISYFR